MAAGLAALAVLGAACSALPGAAERAAPPADAASRSARYTPHTPPPDTPAADTPAATGPPATRPSGTATRAGPVATFPLERIAEASGLARSVRNQGVLWVLDDGPGTDRLLAVRRADTPGDPMTSDTIGAVLGDVAVEGLDALDAEALASGDCASDDPRPCVFIGDIGDNHLQRDHVTLHRMVEPDVTTGLPADPLPADAVTATYPDGPTNAEAMFVADGRVFIISKASYDPDSGNSGPTRLYELPRFASGQLVPRGVVPVPEPALGLLSAAVGNVVTGADATDGAVILRTYDHAVRFTAPEGDADPATFPTWPSVEVPTSGPLQTEAISFDADGCATLTAGEGDGRIWWVPCRSVPAG